MTLTINPLWVVCFLGGAVQRGVKRKSMAEQASVDGKYVCDNCDVVLGGLAPIHDSIETNGRNVRCGTSFREHAMPRVEAMLFAIDKVNNDSKILKDIKLGIRILDTCGIPSVGTDSAKKFIDLRCESAILVQKCFLDSLVAYLARCGILVE